MITLTLATVLAMTSVPYDIILDNLIEEEGKKEVCYLCTTGHKTIGIGRNLSIKPSLPSIGRQVKVGQSITEEEIEILFHGDLIEALHPLIKLPFWKELSPAQQYVLISMNFNLGYRGLNKFKKFLAAIEHKNTILAIQELKNSKWFSQVGHRGPKLVQVLSTDTIAFIA